MIDSQLYTELPQHLKRSINLAYLKKGPYDEIVADEIVAGLGREFESNGLETDKETPIPTMATTTTAASKQNQTQNAERQQILCRYSKKPGHVIYKSRKRINKEKEPQASY